MALLTLVSIIFVTLGSCSDDSDSGSSVVMLRETSLERLWFLKKAVGLSISPPIISMNQESLSTM